MIGYVYSLDLQAASDLLPANLGRSSLIHQLSSAYGLLDNSQLKMLKSVPAHREELCKYHDAKFVDVLLKYTKDVEVKEEDSALLAEYGLEYDCPVFSGLAEYVREVAGSSLVAARALIDPDQDINIAINWDGGRHHAKKGQASGFCYVQDIVLAIQVLRTVYSRVLYIDLDLHHGDGVESAFLFSDRVLCLSLHRYQAGFFPNTGSRDQHGKGKGKGYTINIPLLYGLSDSDLQHIVEKAILPCIDAYKPEAIVVQCGVDGHSMDPCREWNLSIDVLAKAVRLINGRALQIDGKVLYLGGGGYDGPLASRCYASMLANILTVDLPNDIPEHSFWHEYTSTDHELASSQIRESMKNDNIAVLQSLMESVSLDIEYIRERSKALGIL